MQATRDSELTQIGRTVAERTIGRLKVERLGVEFRLDHMDVPSYYFSVGLAPESEVRYTAQDMIELGIGLSDALGERGDETFPYVEILTTKDWDRRFGA